MCKTIIFSDVGDTRKVGCANSRSEPYSRYVCMCVCGVWGGGGLALRLSLKVGSKFSEWAGKRGGKVF